MLFEVFGEAPRIFEVFGPAVSKVIIQVFGMKRSKRLKKSGFRGGGGKGFLDLDSPAETSHGLFSVKF